MNGKPFKVAFIDINSVYDKRRYDWLTADGTPYIEMDSLDFDDDFLETIYRIYKHTYSKISSDLYLTDKYELLKYTRWVVLQDSHQNVAGFFLCTDHNNGVKLGLAAAIDSRAARAALKTLCINAFNVDGVFAEVSLPLEGALIPDVPEVDARTAEKVLGPEKKISNIDTDGKHYSRYIKNIGDKKKMMVGRPLLE